MLGWLIAPVAVRLPQRYLGFASSRYAQQTMALQQLAALLLLGLDDGPLVLADVKAAYLKAARSAHPDKGGCAERFRQITEAYELLRQRAANEGPKKDDGGADNDEMVFVLPTEEMRKDPYFGARVMMVIGGVRFFGVVTSCTSFAMLTVRWSTSKLASSERRWMLLSAPENAERLRTCPRYEGAVLLG